MHFEDHNFLYILNSTSALCCQLSTKATYCLRQFSSFCEQGAMIIVSSSLSGTCRKGKIAFVATGLAVCSLLLIKWGAVKQQLLGTNPGIRQVDAGMRMADSLTLAQSQTKYELVEDIRTNWLKPPSKEPYDVNFNLMDGPTFRAVKQLHSTVFELLQNKTHGFFVECGAYDGVDLSNTLHLEKDYNWTGLLIEADPKYFEKLMKAHRKAWTINACLGISPMPHKVNMTRIKGQGALSKISSLDPRVRSHQEAEDFEAQCFPLASLLAAVGQLLHVDYFSVDVEGAELLIFENVPWNHVFIKVISVESFDYKQSESISKLMNRQNYTHVKMIHGPWIRDHIFIHNLYARQLREDIRMKHLPYWSG